MQRKKILYVITKSNFGGAQRYVFDLATSLAKDHDVAVAFGGEGTLAQKLHDVHIRTISIPSLIRDVNPLLDIKTFFELVRLFRKERPDVVHLNSSKIAGLGSVAGRLAGVPNIVFTTHGWAFNEKRSTFSRIIIKLLHWITVVCSHHTIAVADKERRDVVHWPFIQGKIRVIHNGIGPINFLDRSFLRSIVKLPTELIVGTISELHPNKGLAFAIKAFAQFRTHAPEAHFVIIGEGEQRKVLEQLIRDLNLENYVHLLGFIKDASTYLKAFDIFTLTSQKEGFPYVILEAGAAGLPVIATSVGGIPEVIKDSMSGFLVKPGDINGIAISLKKLLDPNLRTNLGSELHQTVTTSYTLQQMVRNTVALYNTR